MQQSLRQLLAVLVVTENDPMVRFGQRRDDQTGGMTAVATPREEVARTARHMAALRAPHIDVVLGARPQAPVACPQPRQKLDVNNTRPDRTVCQAGQRTLPGGVL